MESWRNRKTLILGRSDMIGLLAPSEYVDCVEHAFRNDGEEPVRMLNIHAPGGFDRRIGLAD